MKTAAHHAYTRGARSREFETHANANLLRAGALVIASSVAVAFEAPAWLVLLGNALTLVSIIKAAYDTKFAKILAEVDTLKWGTK